MPEPKQPNGKLAELEARLAALEQTVARLEARLNKATGQTGHWWRDQAGTFANDPVYDEIVRLGREYRESLHPDRKRKRTKKKTLGR